VLIDARAGIRKPEGLAFDEQGNLYVADNVDNVVYVRSPGGELRVLLSAKDGLGSPESICTWRNTLWITDSRGGRVLRYDRRGLVAVALLAGKLKNVQGIGADGAGAVYVTIQDLKRHSSSILKFTGVNEP